MENKIYIMVKKDMSYDPKFANWNKFYDDLFLEISQIRELGHKALLDFNNNNGFLLSYYSRITNLYSSHRHYINKDEIMIKELLKIEDVIFSAKYLKAIEKKNNSKEQHVMIIRALRGLFANMCSSFSANGISVKVSGKKKRNPKEAILEGYD